MVILRYRGSSDQDELLKKLKKMHKFTKELIECIDDAEEDEYEEEYRHHKDSYPYDDYRGGRTRYRRGM